MKKEDDALNSGCVNNLNKSKSLLWIYFIYYSRTQVGYMFKVDNLKKTLIFNNTFSVFLKTLYVHLIR